MLPERERASFWDVAELGIDILEAMWNLAGEFLLRALGSILGFFLELFDW